jgi:hypothetical protein
MSMITTVLKFLLAVAIVVFACAVCAPKSTLKALACVFSFFGSRKEAIKASFNKDNRKLLYGSYKEGKNLLKDEEEEQEA